MHTPEDQLEAMQPDLASAAEEQEATTGVDRRAFLFLSLTAAAATTFATPALRAQAATSANAASRARATAVPYPLGNATPPVEQFMPYPGGTGALMEKIVREHGVAAFDRATFRVEPWSGPVPTADDAIAFLPAHRQAALIESRRLTSTRLTRIYLERLKRLDPTLRFAVTILESSALAEAARADAEIAAGRYLGPLHGLPYGLKDLFATKACRPRGARPTSRRESSTRMPR